MKNKSLSRQLLFVFTLLFIWQTGQAQVAYFGHKMEGGPNTNAHITKSLRSEYSGHVYITGWFTDSLDVDHGTGTNMLTSPAGVRSAFVAKYDAYGDLLWALHYTSSLDSAVVYDISEDPSGNLYVAGAMNGNVNIDPLASGMGISAGPDTKGFIGLYNPSGGIINYGLMGGTTGNACITTVYATNSTVQAGGWFTGTVDLDPSALTANYTATSGKDAFVGDYDISGGFTNSIHRFESSIGDEVITHIMYETGVYFMVGYYTSEIDLNFSAGTATNFSNGGTDVFFAVTDASFIFSYGHGIGGTGNDLPKAVAKEYSNEFAVGFEYSSSGVNVNPLGTAVTLPFYGGTDVGVVCFNTFTGLHKWSHAFGNSGPNKCHFLGRDLYDNYSLGMNFTGSMDIDPGPATVTITAAVNPVNAVAVSLDGNDNGEYRDSYRVDATTCHLFSPFMFSDNNDIIMVGEFTGTNVDIIPYDSVSLVTHPTNNALYMTMFRRCRSNVSVDIAAPYPCFSCNISLQATVAGAVAPYNISWSDLDNGEIVFNKCPDYYSAGITDFFGCTASSNLLYINDHDGYPFAATVTPVPSSCGNNYGSASALVTDNMGAISYHWSNGDTTTVADSLEAGIYTVQIMDTTQCYITETFTVGNTDGPSINLTSSANPNCSGLNTGGVNITVTGGIAPYTFLWSNGATTEDLSGVGPGTYAVIVTDAAGCQNQLCTDVTAPDEMGIYQLGGAYSTCFFNNGELSVAAYGGTPPYTYQWDAAAGFQTDSIASNLFAGQYTVTVTDNNGCSQSAAFGLSDAAGPSVTTNLVNYPSCYYGPGSIDVNVSGSSSYSYLWSNGEITQDIYNLDETGLYLLTVTAASGCKTVYGFYLDPVLPNTPDVCMVSVDETGTQNVVVWDKTTTPEAAYYKIYREGFCNSSDFLPVGTVDHDSLSVFYDTVVNTETRSWQYYVTAVDSCGNESVASTINKTIHLTSVYNAVADVVVLNWEAYLGKEVLQYDIYRIDPVDSTIYTRIDSVNGVTLTYNDDDNLGGYSSHDIQYYVEAVPISPCYASRAFNQNASRSNHTRLGFGTFDTTAVHEKPVIEDLVRLYPNPANDRFNVRVTGNAINYHLAILNQLGQQVGAYDFRRSVNVSTSALQQGIYYVVVSNELKQNKVFKLVVAH